MHEMVWNKSYFCNLINNRNYEQSSTSKDINKIWNYPWAGEFHNLSYSLFHGEKSTGKLELDRCLDSDSINHSWNKRTSRQRPWRIHDLWQRTWHRDAYYYFGRVTFLCNYGKFRAVY